MAEQLFDGYHGDIVVYRTAEVQTGDLTVLGNERYALLDDILRRVDLDLLALDEDLTLRQLVHTEDALDQLAAACAYQTADAENLAATNRKADALYLVVGADDVLCFKDHIADLRIQLGEHISDLAADHHFDELRLVQILSITRTDVLTIAVNADAVADGEDLVHAVRNVDDRNALCRQLADMLEQQFNLTVGDGGGRLVHDNDLGVDGNCLDDLDQLALCNGEVAQLFLRGNVQTALLDELFRFCDLCLCIDQTVFAELASDEDIFIHGHIQNRVQLLMDHGNTMVHGFLRVRNVIRLTVEDDLAALVLGVNAHQNFHQGGFTGAVLAHQGVYLTGFYLKLHMIERLYAGERLADIFHFQYILHAVLPSSCVISL